MSKVVGFVAKSDQRKMADRIGDADNFRTSKRITDDGVVTMRTQGKIRSRFELEEDERKRVAVQVPTLAEIDLSGAATQADRLYYHYDPQDELRIWSSDGLLSMVVTPLQRIIFKTSAITPAARFSLWLCNEDDAGTQSAPVITGDANPVAQEVAGSRTFHPETYVYPRNDTLVNYSPLKGLGFALKRVAGISALLDGVQYTFSFAGFDQSQQAVAMPGLPECPTPIEQSFTKRKYSTSGIKYVATMPARIKLAEPGGLLPFAKKSITLSAKEHSGDAAVVRPINDLCRVEAFGQPWHGYLRRWAFDKVLLKSTTDPTVLLANDKLKWPSPYAASWFKRYAFGASGQSNVDGKSLLDSATFINGQCSPLNNYPITLDCDGMFEEFLCKSDDKIFKLRATLEYVSTGEVGNYLVITKRRRVDDFLENSDTAVEELLRQRIYLKFAAKDPAHNYIQFATRGTNFRVVIKRGDVYLNEHVIYVLNYHGGPAIDTDGRSFIAWYGKLNVAQQGLSVTIQDSFLGPQDKIEASGDMDPEDPQSGVRYLRSRTTGTTSYGEDFQSVGSSPVPTMPGYFQHLETTFSGSYNYEWWQGVTTQGEMTALYAFDICYIGGAWQFMCVGSKVTRSCVYSSTKTISATSSHSKVTDVPISGYDEHGNPIPGNYVRTENFVGQVSGSKESTATFSGEFKKGFFKGQSVAGATFVSGVTKNLSQNTSDSQTGEGRWYDTAGIQVASRLDFSDGTWHNLPFDVWNGSRSDSGPGQFLPESTPINAISRDNSVPEYTTTYPAGTDPFAQQLIPFNWDAPSAQYPYAAFFSRKQFGNFSPFVVVMQGIDTYGDGYLWVDGVLTQLKHSDEFVIDTIDHTVKKADSFGYIF